MKETSTLKKLTKGKKLLFILVPACALVLAGGIITTAVLTSRSTPSDVDLVTPDDPVDEPTDGKNDDGKIDDVINTDDPDDGKDVSGDAVVFYDPLKKMNILHTFGFYYNSTLNSYYEHEGIDVSATEGAEVYATTDGKITAVYTGDLLTGGQITLESSEGIVTIYNFVDPVEGLAVGNEVKKGDLLATVSAPTGGEYKDGAHVHVEVYLNGVAVDPENYLTSTQK